MLEVFLLVFLAMVSSFAVTGRVLPVLIRRMKRRGLTGKDMNKFGKPEVAELGGIGVILGFSFGIMLAIFAATYFGLAELNLTVLLAGFATIVLVGFLGIVDDLIGWKQGIRQWQHALVPLFAALPLMAIKISNPPMVLPFIGLLPAEFQILGIVVSFGFLYSLILVPLGITGASNAFNMLAGFNGLEAGLGVLVSGTMLLISGIDILKGVGSIEAMVLLGAILGALIAFLRYNWYPARIFGGDSLTLIIGASVAAVAIIGNMEKIAIVLIALFFVELVFKAKHKFQSECFGVPQEDGTLKADPKGGSLTQWVMRQGKFTEKQVVGLILGMQFIVCIFAFLIFFANML